MPKPPNKAVIADLEAKTENALALAIVDRMEDAGFWLYDKKAEENQRAADQLHGLDQTGGDC